jgi:glycosyltransferase 2 family protein
VVSLAGVVWWTTQQPAPKLPSGPAEIASLAGAIAAYAAATLLRGERWWRLLQRGGAQSTRTDAYCLVAVGYMGNNVLPARGGDAMRVYLQAPRARMSMREVIGTLLAERLLDLATLLTLFAVLTYGVLRGIDAPGGGRLALTAVAVAALAGVTAVLVYVARRHPLVRRVLGFVGPMTVATRELQGRHGLAMAGLTLAIWTAEATTYLMAAGAVGLEMSPIEALYVVALISVFILIPSGPGYAGTLDAAALFGVRAIGGSGSQALSYLITLRFVLLVPITIAGLALLIARYGGWSRVRARRAEASA